MGPTDSEQTKQIVKEYSNGEVTIVWKPGLCTHSANCARGLANVFKPKEKPWIYPTAATTQQIIDQVGRCPSGALSTYLNKDSAGEANQSQPI